MKKGNFFSFPAYRGMKRGIYVLFFARIVNRMGDFVQLFLVLYLTTRLNFDEAAAGRFVLMTGLMNGLGLLAAGYLADRFNRKVVLVVCQLAFAAAYAVCGFLPETMTVPWLIFGSSLFRGATWPVTTSMVADLTEGAERKSAFSLLYLGTNLGVAVGPLIAGLLFTNHLPWIFWGDAATTLFAVIAVILFIPDTKPAHEKIEASKVSEAVGERAEEGKFFRVFLRRPILLSYLLIAMVVSFVYSQHQFSLPLQINLIFPTAGPRFYGYIMTINASVVLLSTALITKLTRNIRPVLNMALASLLYMIGFGAIYFIETLPLFFISTVIWTWGEILMVTNGNVFVASNTPITHRGRFNSIISFVHGFGFAFSPWISGALISSRGVSVMWPVTAAAAFIGMTAYCIMDRTHLRSGL